MESQAPSAAHSSSQDFLLGELGLKRKKIDTVDLPERIANEDGCPLEKIFKKQECIKDGVDEEPKRPTACSEGSEEPSTSSKEPSASYEEPSTSSKEPSTSSDEPSASYEEPSTSSDEPSASYEEPSTSSKEPSTSSDEPSASYEEPSTSSKEPSTSSKEPSASYEEPSTSSKEPSTSSDEPSASYEEPSTSYGEPTTASLETGPIVPGMVVWVKYGKTAGRRYLGIVIPSIPRLPIKSPHYRTVFWFKEHRITRVALKNTCHFTNQEVYRDIREVQLMDNGLSEAVQIICTQYTLRFNLPKPNTLEEFIAWVKKEKFQDGDHLIPAQILKQIEAISNKGIEIDPEDGPSKQKNVEVTRFGVDFEDRDTLRICLGCREATQIKKEPHPLVEGFLCGNCHMRVVENQMVLRFNQKHFRYCAICGWLDKYVYCDGCKRVICRTCMMFWVGEDEYRQAAKDAFKWSCIFCVKHNMSPTKLVVKDCNSNTEDCVHTIESTWPQPMEVKLPRQEGKDKPALRVLSLFDGICAGMLNRDVLYALSNLGIKVDKYFASEIDNDAIMVTQSKFGDAVKQIGDVKDITSETIKEYLPIHVLVGGSPCNDLSKVNHARKGLTDFNGSGTLFFEFYRIMKLIDDHQGTPRTFFYLYENVASMDVAHKDTMSRFFESSPICIDAKFLAAMSRPRLFWGNIPQMGSLAKEFLLNARDSNESTLQEHLTPNLRRKATMNQIRTVTTNKNSLTRNISQAWCVQVVQALFRPLTELFQMEEPPTE